MKILAYHTIIGCFAILFVGCEKDIKLNGSELSSRMAINSILDIRDNDHVIKISESTYILSNKPDKPIENPQLQIKINGQDCENLSFDRIEGKYSYFNFKSPLAAGDKIEITSITPEYGTLYGVDYVPDAPEIKNVAYNWFQNEGTGESFLRALITIKDNPDKKNYYRIRMFRKLVFREGTEEDDETPWHNLDIHIDQEILFNELTVSTNDDPRFHYRIFPDDLIQGKEYTLNLYVREDRLTPDEDPEPGGDYGTYSPIYNYYLKVELQELSENLYTYLRSVELARNDDNFKEPVKIYTNIEGGFGILGSYNSSELIIKID